MDGSIWTRAPESTAPLYTAVTSTAAWPGQVVSRQAIQQARTKDRLLHLLRKFERIGFSHDASCEGRISPITRSFSEKFLRLLPMGKALPKITPDGEGGLIMAWEGQGETVLVTVDGSRLHAVIAAGTQDAQYIDDCPFDGSDIPDDILNVIPGM